MHLCTYRLKVPQNALLLYPPQGEAGKGEKKRNLFGVVIFFHFKFYHETMCHVCQLLAVGDIPIADMFHAV